MNAAVQYRAASPPLGAMTAQIITTPYHLDRLSVLAQERFGASFLRDPKVVLSLLMWAVYLVLLFTRWNIGWRGRRAAILSTVAFLAATVTWAANYFSAVHGFVSP